MGRNLNPSGTDYTVLQMRGPSKASGAVTIDAYQIQEHGPNWTHQSGGPDTSVVGTYSDGAPINEDDYALRVVGELGPYATLAEAQAAAGRREVPE